MFQNCIFIFTQKSKYAIKILNDNVALCLYCPANLHFYYNSRFFFFEKKLEIREFFYMYYKKIAVTLCLVIDNTIFEIKITSGNI